MLPLDLALGDAVGGGGDQLDLVDRRVADALDFAQPRDRRMNHLGKGAECLEQRFGQRLGVAPGQRRKQRHLQQFVIAQRIGPGVVKALAQPLAMAVIMRRLGGFDRLRFAGLRGHRPQHAAPASFCNRELPAADEPGYPG